MASVPSLLAGKPAMQRALIMGRELDYSDTDDFEQELQQTWGDVSGRELKPAMCAK